MNDLDNELSVKKKKFEFPHVFALLFFMIILTALFTYFIPSGEYDREITEDDRTVVIDGTYHEVEGTSIGFFDIFQIVHKGMVEGSSIIFFILIIGGAFGILNATKSIDTALLKISTKAKGREAIIIPIVMAFFSLGGATFGMSEEIIPFILIMIPLALRLGYDSIVGLAMVIVGVYSGYAGAFLNPFTIGVAQGIAELPLFSGLGYRILVWFIYTALGISFVMLYARKIKKDPTKSSMYEIDKTYPLEETHESELSKKQLLILVIFGMTIVGLGFGVIVHGWYITEIAALFLIMGVLSGIVYLMPINKIAENFVDGCKDIIVAALSVGLAYGILVALQDSLTIDTVLYTVSTWVNQLPQNFAGIGMYITQSIMNLLVPSGSGQAALTMPIMTPLADLTGVSRQTAVFAFQLGDAISNTALPTSGVVMGSLALAGVSWNKWLRWLLPLLIMQYALGAVLIIIAQTIIWP